MSEIIPILELVNVDLPRCDGCYFHDQKNNGCKDEIEKFQCVFIGSGWKIWKEVTK